MKKRTSGPTITRAPKDADNPYTPVRRLTFEDKNLSWEARGVLAYLLVKKDNWIIQVNDLIASSPGGRDKVYRILAELEKHGYLERHNEKTEDGKFGGVSYHLYELPLPEKPHTAKPDTDSPDTGKPLPENPEHSNKEELLSTKKALSTEERECSSASADGPAPDPDNSYDAVFGKGTTSFDPPPHPPPKQSIQEEWNKPLSEMEPHRALFAAVLDAMGWDRATLIERDRARVAQACRVLQDAGYVWQDVGEFMTRVWFRDWRWTEKESRPTLNQLRQEIGKVRAGVPVELPKRQTQGGDAVDAFFDRLEQQEIYAQ